MQSVGSPVVPSEVPTRERVLELLLQRGPQTASALSSALGLSSAAVRRHLDGLSEEGMITSREQRAYGSRGRGRPARVFLLTDVGRETFPHAYDDLALQALRYLKEAGGEEAILDFARSRLHVIARKYGARMSEGSDVREKAEVLAAALTSEGYAAEASQVPTGSQLCQHHCPVGHVSAEFPELCEAETELISGLLGTHVQRLATIAHGDGICTTHIPARTSTRTTEPSHTTETTQSGRTA
jgi:predicted ArsR family transcriptional regulator